MSNPVRVFASTVSRRLVRGSVYGTRAGMGQPVGSLPPPSEPLAESQELTWDDGTANPEPAIDVILPHYSETKGLGLLLGGLSVFVAVGFLAKWNDKASRVPFTPREYPYDNLRVELGGEP